MSTDLRRSALYVPADSPKMMEKSLSLPADMLLLNLEDGVAFSKKDEARTHVVAALQGLDFKGHEVVVRINSLASEIGFRDLHAIVPCRPHGICLPKVEDAGDIQEASAALLQLEMDHGLPEAGIRLHAMIESAAGVVNAAVIARASRRMSSLILGTADLSKDLHCRPGEDRSELWLALQTVVLAARAAGIDAIDAPCFEVRNQELLSREAAQARRLGYDGKSAIHPGQLEIINSTFDVTAEEVAWAETVLAELRAAESSGKGLSTFEGRLIEDPHRATAERILRRKSGK